MTTIEAIKAELHQRVEKLNMANVKEGTDPVLFYKTYDVNFQITESELKNKKDGKDEASN